MGRLIILMLAVAATQAGCLGYVGYAQEKRATVVTNGELTPGKEFHLLLIHDGGQYSQHVASMLTQPRAQMIDWVRASNVRLMHFDEPQAIDHHADLLQKHQGQMPILAFIQQTADDGRGAVWCSAAGNQIASDESSLASWLGRYYQATGEAAMRSNQLAVVAGPRNLQAMQNGATFAERKATHGSYFMPRSNGAPPAFQPDGGRRPLINPQLDVAVPDTLNTAVGLNSETRMTLIFVAVLAIVCCLLLGASPIISAVIIGHAITDDDGPNRPTPPTVNA
jgi:hypothetical protein